MDRLLKISEKTNIVIHALAYIASRETETHISVKQIAEELKVSTTYLAKVLQPIVKEGILDSVRGAKGGFLMKKDPAAIKLIDLVIMVEGSLPEHHCLFGNPICAKGHCIFSEINKDVEEILKERLSKTTLKDLVESFK